jgi:hypothetical protein
MACEAVITKSSQRRRSESSYHYKSKHAPQLAWMPDVSTISRVGFGKVAVWGRASSSSTSAAES